MDAAAPDLVDAPPIVAELVGVIGAAAYRQLEDALGGSQIYVPRHPGPENLIVRAVGPETAAQICEYFHGQKLLLPVGSWRRRMRAQKAEILELGKHMSANEIARRLKVSRSWAYEVLRGTPDTRQLRMFD